MLSPLQTKSAPLPPLSIKRRGPPLGPFPDYSRVIYADPPSHDFCVWLVISELMRRYHKSPPPLRVTLLFTAGQLGKIHHGSYSIATGMGWEGTTLEYSNLMVPNIIRPAIKMIGAVNDPDLHAPIVFEQVSSHVEYDYHIWQLIDAGRDGYRMPYWKVPQWAIDEVIEFLGDIRPIVVSLREFSSQWQRNSNTIEWLKFAEYIEKRHPVLFVRDTAMLNFPLGRFKTWHRASSNVYIRAALYQRAFCNLMVQNGCFVWVQFSKAPYLIFKQLVPQLPNWEHGQRKGWLEDDHMDIGDQYPWATPQQRMTWKDDTFENIRDEFEMFEARVNG